MSPYITAFVLRSDCACAHTASSLRNQASSHRHGIDNQKQGVDRRLHCVCVVVLVPLRMLGGEESRKQVSGCFVAEL